MRWIFEVDLVGSVETVPVEADDSAQATSLVAAMFPEARSVTLAGAEPVLVHP